VAALLSGVTCELICDGAHVSPPVMEFAYGMLGPTRLVVVTDNLYLAGTEQLTGRFAGGNVERSGAVARRGDGTIVGSTLTMDHHFRNVLGIGVDLPAAATVCSTNAARLVGEDLRRSIAPGQVADIVLIDGANEIAATICRGDVAYLRDAWRLTA
jgi:N-acetylglucosamine-6-phosphate deacetylase